MSRQTTVELTAEVMNEVQLAKTELGGMAEKQGKMVNRIGHAVARDPSLDGKLENVCRTIKYLLSDEIAKGIITEKTIENACPDEWKNQTKAAAGRAGGEKTSAGRQTTTTDEGVKVDAAEFRQLKTDVEKLKEILPLAKQAVRAAIEDGDYMKIPKAEFTALAEVVGLA